MISPSNLYYHGTQVMLELGDRVDFRSAFFRRSRPGTICCIPARTARVLAQEQREPEDWLLKFDNGMYTGWLYSPEDLQPGKRLIFLSRGKPGYEGISNDQLEQMDAEADT
jgi:hypothetical protein